MSAYTENDELVIQVRDTGRGIPADDIAHVWEDLYRSADVQGIPGSGVGLAMVKSIIEQHGGHVMVESELARETVFRLYLPYSVITKLRRKAF